MANNIELMKQYVALLDKVYAKDAKTSVLDSSNVVQQGANANEILVPKMSMDGLADYNKDTGYVNGSVSLEYETLVCDYDRGRKFQVDAMDNQETANIAFGQLAGEFIRTKVAPELDGEAGVNTMAKLNALLSSKSKPAASKAYYDAWIAALQKECNRQGYSHQAVDGVAGPATLAGCPTVK